MYRLKTTETAIIRARILALQGGCCAICKLPCKKPVLDHDHATGAVRGVACNGCNAVLGKVENNYKRYGVQNLHAFTNGIASYLQAHAVNTTGYLHSTFKTEDEKRIARNSKARLARAAKKEL